jgi:hypothetical protein
MQEVQPRRHRPNNKELDHTLALAAEIVGQYGAAGSV